MPVNRFKSSLVNSTSSQQPKKINRLKRGYYRQGPDYRNNRDMNFAEIRKAFGFRSIQVGRWVTEQEQQIAANLIYDALMDLAEILRVPPQILSLRGSLSLAFGTGGQKYVQAHYDMRKRELALAKNAGGGALAHEWFHAFDHYINDKIFQLPKEKFASNSWLYNKEPVSHPLNQKLAQFFKTIFLAEDGRQPSPYLKTNTLIDQKLKQYYFAMPEELAARAFESVIQDHEIKNAYLVSGTKKSEQAELGIFPKAKHRVDLACACYDYFNLLGKLVLNQ